VQRIFKSFGCLAKENIFEKFFLPFLKTLTTFKDCSEAAPEFLFLDDFSSEQ
jgi:hypothetical protein